MNARPLPKLPSVKPPPVPKPYGLSVVPPLPPSRSTVDSEDVTAVGEAPPELLETARSDVRELRAARSTPPRPTRPPPLPTSVRPAASPDTGRRATGASSPAPAVTSVPPPAPAVRPEATSEVAQSAAVKPRPLVLARTTWFFGVFVATGVFRWTVERFSRGGAWLVAEWRHAAIRANPPR